MKALSQKSVYAILMGAMFCFCLIFALESKFEFGWMLGGFLIMFVVSFIFLYVRNAPLVIFGTIVLVMASYLIYKIGDAERRQTKGISTAIGAIAGIMSVMMIQFGWVKQSQEANVDLGDYRKQQQAIYEQEKAQKQAQAPVVQDPGSQGKPPV